MRAGPTTQSDAPAPSSDVPGNDLATRRERLRGALVERSLDCALIAAPRDILYLTGVICGGVLIVPADAEPVLVAHRIAARIRPLVPFEVRTLRGRDDIRTAMQSGGAAHRVGVARSRLSAVVHAQLLSVAAAAEVEDITTTVETLRMRKSDWEVIQIRRAAVQASDAMSVAAHAFEKGASDLEMQLAVEAWMRRRGHPGLGHGAASEGASVVVLAGADAAIPGYLNAPLGGPGIQASAPVGPRGVRPRDDEAVIVDLVGHHAGYFADQTRTMAGGEMTPVLSDGLRACEEALAAMERRLRAGEKPSRIAGAASEVIAAAGHSEHWMGDGESAVSFVGHGIGLSISEPPYFTTGNDLPLQAGTVVALEPKLAFADLGMVGIEHTYLVRDGDAERLTFTRDVGDASPAERFDEVVDVD